MLSFCTAFDSLIVTINPEFSVGKKGFAQIAPETKSHLQSIFRVIGIGI